MKFTSVRKAPNWLLLRNTAPFDFAETKILKGLFYYSKRNLNLSFLVFVLEEENIGANPIRRDFGIKSHPFHLLAMTKLLQPIPEKSL